MLKINFLKSAITAGLLLTTCSVVPVWAQAVVTMNIAEPFSTLDPAKITDEADYLAVINLYDALLTVLPGGSLAPELAESWEVSDDAREVVFKIRDDATFSDGSPVEAGDVIYSVERLLRINQGPANLFSDILGPGSVTAIDDKTVRFQLSKTFSPFLSTVPLIFIVNADVARENEGTDDAQTFLTSNPSGAGAYLLREAPSGSGMTIVRDENYYGGFNERPIDEVRWIVVNDEATARSLAASGELTLASTFLSPDTYRAMMEMGRFNLTVSDTATAYLLKLNTQVAPTDDVHIRRAIAYATDYETVREVIYPGGVLKGPLPSSFSDFVPDDLPTPVFDLEAARAEIAQSKYAGQPIPITLGYVSNIKFEEEISLLMQANLEQLGFVVTQQGDTWNRITELAADPKTSPAVNHIFFGPTYPSPDSMFFTQYHSASAGTWAAMEGLNDPEVDSLIDQARASADPEEQIALYKELQHKLVDMQVDVFLLSLNAQIVMDKCLTGYEFAPMQAVGHDFTRYSWLCD